MPKCLESHLNIRSSYIWKDHVVMLAEISNLLYAEVGVTIDCLQGEMKKHRNILSRWVYNAFNYTHTTALLFCQHKDSINSAGILYFGNDNCNDIGRKNVPNELDAYDHTFAFLDEKPEKSKKEAREIVLKNTREAGLPSSFVPITTLEIQKTKQFEYCAMSAVLHGSVPFGDQWLFHQKWTGVQHVIWYHDSTLILTENMKELISNGYLELQAWDPNFNKTQIFYRSQHLAITDYVYRFRGLCEWTIFLDSDDFFTNWKHNHSLHQAVTKRIENDSTIYSIKFPWPKFYPECDGIDWEKLPKNSNQFLRNLTHSHVVWYDAKHVSRTALLDDEGVHNCDIDKNLKSPPPFVYLGAAVWHIRPNDQYAYACTETKHTDIENYRQDPSLYKDYFNATKYDPVLNPTAYIWNPNLYPAKAPRPKYRRGPNFTPRKSAINRVANIDRTKLKPIIKLKKENALDGIGELTPLMDLINALRPSQIDELFDDFRRESTEHGEYWSWPEEEDVDD